MDEKLEDYIIAVEEHYEIKSEFPGRTIVPYKPNRFYAMLIEISNNKFIEKVIPAMKEILPFTSNPMYFLKILFKEDKKIDENKREDYYNHLSSSLKERTEHYYNMLKVMHRNYIEGVEGIEEPPDGFEKRLEERKVNYRDAKWSGIVFGNQDYDVFIINIANKYYKERIEKRGGRINQDIEYTTIPRELSL